MSVDTNLESVQQLIRLLTCPQAGCDQPQCRAADVLRALLTEREAAEAKLAECYRLTGADTDGNEDWRLAPNAVDEVRRLRADKEAAEARAATFDEQVTRQASIIATLSERAATAEAQRDDLHLRLFGGPGSIGALDQIVEERTARATAEARVQALEAEAVRFRLMQNFEDELDAK